MNGELLRDMRAVFGAAVRPGFIFATYLCFALPATIILLTKITVYNVAGMLFAVGTTFTTIALGFGSLALAHDVHDLRLPRRRASLLNSHAAIMITTVSAMVMPGLLIAVLYRDWVPAATCIGGALFALFVSVLPFYAMSAIFAVIVLAAYRDGAVFATVRGYIVIAALPAGMMLAALALWRWRAVLVGGTGRHVFGFLRAQNLSTTARGANLTRRPDRTFASMPPVRSQPPPVRAIRTLFGEPYAPVPISRRLWQLFTQGAIVIGGLIFLVLFQRHSMRETVQIFQLVALPVLGGAAWVAGTVFSASLGEIYRHGSSEMVELSLLPGLGAARARRRSLYEACLVPPILVLIGILVTALLVAWVEHRFASTYASIIMFAITALLVIAAGILRILIGRDFRRGSSQQAGAVGLFIVTLVAALACATDHGQAKELIAHRVLPGVWFALVWVTSAVILYRSARQLTSRPHPFVAT